MTKSRDGAGDVWTALETANRQRISRAIEDATARGRALEAVARHLFGIGDNTTADLCAALESLGGDRDGGGG